MQINQTITITATAPKTAAIRKGSYVLNRKYSPAGANLVEFEIQGDQINVNYAGWRKATDSEIVFCNAILTGMRGH